MKRQIFTPRAYQPLATGHMLNTRRCALFAGMGMGKTVSTLNALNALYLSGEESQPTLVLGPLRVARSVWSDEAAKWDHLSGIEISPIVGTQKERKAALQRDVPIYTTNYENLPWLVESLGVNWRFSTVVADESRKLKSFRSRQGGVRSAALRSLAHTKIRRWLNLTGRPASKGLEDLWGQMWFIDQGDR